MLKRKFKWCVETIFRLLPGTMQASIFDHYCRNRGEFAVFRELANRFNVISIKVNNNQGIIEGSINDTAVMQRYASEGAWANRTVELFKGFFRENPENNGTYFDIGANIGLTIIPIAQLDNVKCFGFEPEKCNFEYLTSNVSRNCPPGQVEIVNVALADQTNRWPLELSPENFGDHRLRLGENASLLKENTWDTIMVDVIRLDEFFDRASSPIGVKIDVQGAEPLVIAGGKSILEKAGLIVLEFSPYWMNRMGTDPEVVIELVESFPRTALAYGESAVVGKYVSGKKSAIMLMDYFKENRDTPIGAYCDVILRRD